MIKYPQRLEIFKSAGTNYQYLWSKVVNAL
jgi:hypothetical protein